MNLFFLQRGKTVPEGLVTTEDIKSYKQLASHTVSHQLVEGAIQTIKIYIEGLRKTKIELFLLFM
jgi:hypothetical protein